MTDASKVMPFSWSPALSVGNDEIDHQHQTLIEKINTLPSQSSPDFHAVIEHLLEYCFEHFQAEEAWMRKIGYPGYRDHLQHHNRLGEQFHAFFRDYNRGQIDHARFRRFLFHWIKDHILEEDVKIASFFYNR